MSLEGLGGRSPRVLGLAVQHVNKLKPRFLLVSGDLTNAWPVGPSQDPQAAAKQVVAVKEAERDAHIRHRDDES